MAAEAENTYYKSMFDHKSICIKILRKNLNIVCSLNKCKLNSNATNKFKLFTDDTHLFISGIDKNANNNECNDRLETLNNWSLANCLCMNSDKTNFMVLLLAKKWHYMMSVSLWLFLVQLCYMFRFFKCFYFISFFFIFCVCACGCMQHSMRSHCYNR